MFDKYADEAIEAEIWLKGREQGRDNRNVEMALDMLADDEPVEKIVKYSRLPESKILELKQSLAKETRK